MYAIDSAGSTAGQFTDGDPGTGVPSTVVPAAWLNEVQGEILAVLAQGDVTPVKGVRTQLRDAILAMIGDAFSPIGEPRIHWGPVSSLASNELPLDGRALVRASYPALFARYGTAFNTTATALEFNIPNFRDTYITGAGGLLDYAARAGSNTVTPTMAVAGDHNHGGQTQGHALNTSELPPHEHTVVADRYVANDDATGVSTTSGSVLMADRNQLDQANTETDLRATNTGGGQAHAHAITTGGAHLHVVNPVDNRPQTLAMVWKIRAL
jgi:microcystin-dependent protein